MPITDKKSVVGGVPFGALRAKIDLVKAAWKATGYSAPAETKGRYDLFSKAWGTLTKEFPVERDEILVVRGTANLLRGALDGAPKMVVDALYDTIEALSVIELGLAAEALAQTTHTEDVAAETEADGEATAEA